MQTQTQWAFTEQARCLQGLRLASLMAEDDDFQAEQDTRTVWTESDLRWMADDVRVLPVSRPCEHLAVMDALIAAGYTILGDDGVSIAYTD